MNLLTRTTTQEQQVKLGQRFSFGENWKRYLTVIDENRIQDAVHSLQQMLEVDDLNGKSFLDIGSGSGLFSLAARRMGARVLSFDFDPHSVSCTRELKRRFFEHDTNWDVQTGSVLDNSYLASLGKFDVVYSWGVLHHTGRMWEALANVAQNVGTNGKLFIALYNYQPFASRYWTWVKRTYNKWRLTRPIFVVIHTIYPTLPSAAIRLVQQRKSPRGMSMLYDLYDWLGGYPFEVARPEQIFDFYKRRGYELTALKTVGGRLGCNEFVFQRNQVAQK